MNGINIDNNGRIVMNPCGVDTSSFAVPEKITQAENTASFEANYVPPVSFDGGFGNPAAFDALQSLLARREASIEVQQSTADVAEMSFAAAQTEMLPC